MNSSGVCRYVVDHIKALAAGVPTIRATCSGRRQQRQNRRPGGNSPNARRRAENSADVQLKSRQLRYARDGVPAPDGAAFTNHEDV
jgi:hypothetical protein